MWPHASELSGLLRDHVRARRTQVAWLVVLHSLQSVALLYLPTLSADIIDNGVLAGDTGHIWRVGALMIGVTVVQVVCLAAAVRLGAYTALSVGRDLREAMFARVLDLSTTELATLGTPSLITRTANDVQQIQTFLLTGLTVLVAAPVMGIGGVVLALGQDVPLALLLLVMVPVIGSLMLVIVRRLRPLQRILQRSADSVNGVLREQVVGVRVIRAFNRDEYERRRFADINTELTEVGIRSGRLSTLMLPLAATVTTLFCVPVVWIGAYRVDAGQMQVGALTAFLGYLAQILVGIISATFALMALPRAEASAERVAEVLRTKTSVVPPAKPVTRLPRPGHLELREVEYRLPGAEAAVLRGVDLVARPGETIAVVGSTGSGKSTLLALIARLADVTAGRILVGGVDVRELDRATLSREVCLVPQRAGLFAGTIASNLRFWRPGVPDDELWRALETAQAREFVERMGKGLNSAVTQGGGNLSGGQRQRLAIARALVVRPRIYLFDDSFAALDYRTDGRLRAALAAETADAAVVLVSQRVATIQHAHRILVLEEGAIAGVGTHHELLAGNAVYREIVQSQLAEEPA
ncbi:ATP-binding cassette, subfamily B [Amycolatopsis xylanica]|uniref:ATP-binding cassette, subfamily B n=1 Tax=Amycolatopsis xylanica TaxID=589385 RepID=A0A1H3SCP1_9PSEU|nr:ABC transporter ATP-binding protein [Amycolatopsis xylanica]SDZ35430.1 ATP-binding cassette, subfamily B [Amycolatopsis xylanica]